MRKFCCIVFLIRQKRKILNYGKLHFRWVCKRQISSFIYLNVVICGIPCRWTYHRQFCTLSKLEFQNEGCLECRAPTHVDGTSNFLGVPEYASCRKICYKLLFNKYNRIFKGDGQFIGDVN